MQKLSGLEKVISELTSSVNDLKEVKSDKVAAGPTFASVAASAVSGGRQQQAIGRRGR